MTISMRTVTGVLSHADGTPWTGALVVFAMRTGPYSLDPPITYPQERQGVTTDESGAFSLELTAGLGIWWVCYLPDGYAFAFFLPEGNPVTIERLRAEAMGESVPVDYGTSDIVITNPVLNEILLHNGTQFVNVARGLTVTSPVTGQVLRYDGTQFVNANELDQVLTSGDLMTGTLVFEGDIVPDVVMRQLSNTSTGTQIRGQKNRGATDVHVAASEDDRVFMLMAQASDGTGYRDAVRIDMRVGGSVSTGVVPGAYYLWITDDTGTLRERISAIADVTVLNQDLQDVDFRVKGITDPNLLFVDASTNHVGISTGTPTDTLHVAGGATVDGVVTTQSLTASTGSQLHVLLQTYGGDTDENRITSQKTRGANAATHVAVQDSDKLLMLLAQGSDGTAYRESGRMLFGVDGSVATGIVPGAFFLFTTDAAGVSRERFTLLPTITSVNQDQQDVNFRVKGVTDDALLFVNANTERVGIGTNAPASKLDVASDSIRIQTAKTPTTSGATGTQGQIAWDASYVYVCTATNTWKRAALATW
jgi:hypothetical protein